jgi:hypothetical protein
MDWLQVGTIVANVGWVLSTRLSNAESDLGWKAPDHYDVSVHVIPTAIPSRPTLNLFVHSVDLITGTGATPAPITGLDLFILMSVNDSHSSEKMSDNYRSRQVFGYGLAYLHEHPSYAWVTGGVSNGKAWSAAISLQIQRVPLTAAEAEGFFVAGQAPMALSAAYRVTVQQVTAKKPSNQPPDGTSSAISGDTPISGSSAISRGTAISAITGGTASSRLTSATEFAARNGQPLVWASVSALRDAGVTDLGAHFEFLAAQGHVLAFRDDDLKLGRRIDLDVIPRGSVVVTEDRTVVAALRKAGAALIEG